LDFNAYTRVVPTPGQQEWVQKPRRQLPLEVGIGLRAARIRAGLSQQELAERTAEVALQLQAARTTRYLAWAADGISRRTISYLERGERAPNIRTVRLLIASLDLGKRDPLRRQLLKHVSLATKPTRRARAMVETNLVVGVANRLLSAGGRALNKQLSGQREQAKREREEGIRERKGGWPKRHPLKGRRKRQRSGR
jgi:transcriptional regulator with XRE-family HTH domain